MNDLILEELQKLVFFYGSISATQDFLRLTKEEMTAYRKSGLKSPTEFISDLSDQAFYKEIARLSSHEAMAKFYGVSSSFIKAQVKKRVGEVVYSDLTKEVLEQALDKFGTVALVARMLNLPESRVRAGLKVYGLSGKVTVGRLGCTSGSGRRAELYFIEQETLRYGVAIEDQNAAFGPQAIYDVYHPIYKRVNVKSSLPYKWKAKTRRTGPGTHIFYKVNMRGSENCDNVAFVIMDKGSNPIEWFIIPIDLLKSFGTSTVTVHQHMGRWYVGNPGNRVLVEC